ncbi:GapA-binding peptide SR1P [Bacillus licheniformis]|nr:GapA-binding peptide SR1P [Bacillus licheniformis]
MASDETIQHFEDEKVTILYGTCGQCNCHLKEEE